MIRIPTNIFYLCHTANSLEYILCLIEIARAIKKHLRTYLFLRYLNNITGIKLDHGCSVYNLRIIFQRYFYYAFWTRCSKTATTYCLRIESVGEYNQSNTPLIFKCESTVRNHEWIELSLIWIHMNYDKKKKRINDSRYRYSILRKIDKPRSNRSKVKQYK